MLVEQGNSYILPGPSSRQQSRPAGGGTSVVSGARGPWSCPTSCGPSCESCLWPPRRQPAHRRRHRHRLVLPGPAVARRAWARAADPSCSAARRLIARTGVFELVQAMPGSWIGGRVPDLPSPADGHQRASDRERIRRSGWRAERSSCSGGSTTTELRNWYRVADLTVTPHTARGLRLLDRRVAGGRHAGIGDAGRGQRRIGARTSILSSCPRSSERGSGGGNLPTPRSAGIARNGCDRRPGPMPIPGWSWDRCRAVGTSISTGERQAVTRSGGLRTGQRRGRRTDARDDHSIGRSPSSANQSSFVPRVAVQLLSALSTAVLGPQARRGRVREPMPPGSPCTTSPSRSATSASAASWPGSWALPAPTTAPWCARCCGSRPSWSLAVGVSRRRLRHRRRPGGHPDPGPPGAGARRRPLRPDRRPTGLLCRLQDGPAGTHRRRHQRRCSSWSFRAVAISRRGAGRRSPSPCRPCSWSTSSSCSSSG